MEKGKFQIQLQEQISRWLKSGRKSGTTQLEELEAETVVLSSVLGKRSENQDRTIFLRAKFDEPNRASIATLVLCDGMGGMSSGGDCANLAISTFASSLVNSKANPLIEKLITAVNSANQTVHKYYQGRGGATLSAIACNDKSEWAAVNVGDSRIYRVANSGVVEQLSIDDTLEKQLAHLNLPSPPPEFRQLLQYVGMGQGIEPRQIELPSSDDTKWFLITSDGAHGISEDIFRSLVSHCKTPNEVADRLNTFSEWLGGKDNSTVAILAVDKDLFLKNKGSDFGSLEIVSISGNKEIVNVKHMQTDIPQDRSDISKQNTAEIAITGRENITQPKKPLKRKNQENIPKMDSINGSKYNNGAEKVERLIPQLNIEFSEEG
jgi:PPM family protein phosphatase